jgi:hypothetical protein
VGGEESEGPPITSMTTLEEDIDGWDELPDDERERLRALCRDLGLEETDDPDVFE